MEHQTTNREAAPAHHAGHGGHADHAAQFRERFWWSLALSVPVVAFSGMFADLVGYTRPAGTGWISPLFGVAVFAYGGVPFLKGAAHEIRARQPGMMLLIGLAITVAFTASLATSLHVSSFDLDFWWELALLIDVMLLGHWLEMKAIGQAQGALAALAALLPDEAERVTEAGDVETVPIDALRPGDVVLVRSGARVPADGDIIDGEAEVDESMVTGESRPVPKSAGDRVDRGHRVDRFGDPRTRHRRWRRHGARRHPTPRRRSPNVAVARASARGPRRRVPVLRRDRFRAGDVRRVDAARRHEHGRRSNRDGARDRLPARARAWRSRS